MKIYEHNIETGEAIERDMTAAEVAQFNKDKAESQAKVDAENKAQAAKEIAQAKLAALGLTIDDLAALGL